MTDTELVDQMMATFGPVPQAPPVSDGALVDQTIRALGLESRGSLERRTEATGQPVPEAAVVGPETMGQRAYDLATNPAMLGMTGGSILGTILSSGATLPMILAGLGGAGGQAALETQARGGQPAGRTGLDLPALGAGYQTLPPFQQMAQQGAQDVAGAALGYPMQHPETERIALQGTLGALTEGGAQALSRYVSARLSPRAEKAQQVLGADVPLTLRDAFPPKVSAFEQHVADAAQRLGVIPPNGGAEWQGVMQAAQMVDVPTRDLATLGYQLETRELPIKGDLSLSKRLIAIGEQPSVPFQSAQALANDLGTRAVQVTKEGLPGPTAHDFGVAKDTVLDSMRQALAQDPAALAQFDAAREATRQFHEQVLVAKIIGKATDPRLTLRGADGAEIPVPNGLKLLNLVNKGQRLGRFDGRIMRPETLQNLRDLAEAAAVRPTSGQAPLMPTIGRIIQGSILAPSVARSLGHFSIPTEGEAAAIVGTVIVPKIWTALVNSEPFVRAAILYARHPSAASVATAALTRAVLQATDQVMQAVEPGTGIIPHIPPAPAPSPLPLGLIPGGASVRSQ